MMPNGVILDGRNYVFHDLPAGSYRPGQVIPLGGVIMGRTRKSDNQAAGTSMFMGVKADAVAGMSDDDVLALGEVSVEERAAAIEAIEPTAAGDPELTFEDAVRANVIAARRRSAAPTPAAIEQPETTQQPPAAAEADTKTGDAGQPRRDLSPRERLEQAVRELNARLDEKDPAAPKHTPRFTVDELEVYDADSNTKDDQHDSIDAAIDALIGWRAARAMKAVDTPAAEIPKNASGYTTTGRSLDDVKRHPSTGYSTK